MTLKPYNDRLIVSRDQKEKVSAGGIVLPENYSKDALTGDVISLGNTELKHNIEVGDKVIFIRNAGYAYNENNTEYVILKYEDIAAIIKK